MGLSSKGDWCGRGAVRGGGRGPKRSFSSSSNRCPSLSHTPASSSQSLSLVLMVGARQRGQLEVVEEKEVPFLYHESQI